MGHNQPMTNLINTYNKLTLYIYIYIDLMFGIQWVMPRTVALLFSWTNHLEYGTSLFDVANLEGTKYSHI